MADIVDQTWTIQPGGIGHWSNTRKISFAKNGDNYDLQIKESNGTLVATLSGLSYTSGDLKSEGTNGAKKYYVWIRANVNFSKHSGACSTVGFIDPGTPARYGATPDPLEGTWIASAPGGSQYGG
jgi:hypothetical protein